MRPQIEEPINLLGKDRFREVDIRIRVKGGGHVSQVYGTHRRPVCFFEGLLLRARSRSFFSHFARWNP